MDRNNGEQPAGGTGTVFSFVGEALALDLVNTEVVVRGTAVDLLATPGAYAAWWQAAAAHHPAAAGTATLTAATDPDLLPAVKALRAALRGLFGAVADGCAVDPGDLAALNRVLATGHEVVEPAPDGRLRSIVRARGTGPDAALLLLARSALEVLTARAHGRLHRCGNRRCVLLFSDTTKSATRRWCSVGCMNRVRSARRYRARKTSKVPALGSVSTP